MIIFIALVLPVVLAFGMLVAVSNAGATNFDYVIAQNGVTTLSLLAGCIAAGTIPGAVIIGASVLKRCRKAWRWQHQAELAPKELVDFRSPLLNSL